MNRHFHLLHFERSTAFALCIREILLKSSTNIWIFINQIVARKICPENSRPLGTRTTLLNYSVSVLKARGSSQYPTIIINKLSDIYLNTALAWAPQQHTTSRTKYAFNIFSYTQILATRFLSTQRRFFLSSFAADLESKRLNKIFFEWMNMGAIGSYVRVSNLHSSGARCVINLSPITPQVQRHLMSRPCKFQHNSTSLALYVFQHFFLFYDFTSLTIRCSTIFGTKHV